MCLQKFVRIRREPFVFLLLTVTVIAVSLFLISNNAEAVRDYKQRDYISDRAERYHGVTPVVGIGHTISTTLSQWPRNITFSMKKTHSILVRIDPIEKPAGVIMSASQAASPRLVKAVWAHDDLRQPVTIWTNLYWIPVGECNYTGCPKIEFQATRGTVGITIIEKKETHKAYIK